MGHQPTNFDFGKTFIYINGGAAVGENPNWIKIKLIDPTGKNLDGVGAKIVVNDSITREIGIGGSSFSSYGGDLLIGRGDQQLKTLKVRWPSGSMEYQTIVVGEPIARARICIKRDVGLIGCESVGF